MNPDLWHKSDFSDFSRRWLHRTWGSNCNVYIERLSKYEGIRKILFEQSFCDNIIFLRLLLTFEKIYQTHEVRLSRSITTVFQNYFALDSTFVIPPFPFSSRCLFENVMKHCLSCLVFLLMLVISILFLNLYQYLSSISSIIKCFLRNPEAEGQIRRKRNGSLQKPTRKPLTNYFCDLAWRSIGHKTCCAEFPWMYQMLYDLFSSLVNWISTPKAHHMQWIPSYRIVKVF